MDLFPQKNFNFYTKAAINERGCLTKGNLHNLCLPLTREVARRSRDGGREDMKILQKCSFFSPSVSFHSTAPDGSPYPLSLRDISLHCRESPSSEGANGDIYTVNLCILTLVRQLLLFYRIIISLGLFVRFSQPLSVTTTISSILTPNLEGI